MGIFGDDELQDERIAALEDHVRILTETVQANQVDLAAAWISILALRAQVDDYDSAADVDPTLGALNTQLKEARRRLAEASAAASDSWATLQDGVREPFETLRGSVHEASDRIRKN